MSRLQRNLGAVSFYSLQGRPYIKLHVSLSDNLNLICENGIKKLPLYNN